MGQAERIQEDAVAGQATAKYRARGVPSDWYVDPADPGAAERYNRNANGILEDQATAFLAAHEALLDGAEEPEDDLDPPMELRTPGTVQPVWIGLPLQHDFDDEGELGWQTDALCAQTDPEAFFPEKGGSTRSASGPYHVRRGAVELPERRRVISSVAGVVMAPSCHCASAPATRNPA